MNRWLFLLLLVVVSFPVAAQIEEECMDCVEKTVREWYVGNVQWKQTEAQCCDWFCSGGWELNDEDVGWGCLVDTWDDPNMSFEGTFCNSSSADEGCPPNDPPPPDDGGTIPCTPGEPGCGSPLLLDLGNDHYRLTSIADGVYFDIRNEGEKFRMGWTKVSVENAFLALDRNGNGQVDNGAELFGDATPLQNGAIASDGFAVLTEFDDNGDGVVDAADAIWPRLLLWTDRNHDGFSIGNELRPIANSGVLALSTEHRTVRRKDQWGNLFRYKAKFWIRKNGKTQQRTYYDVFFKIRE